MDSLPDSTDWLETPLKDFAQLENALHCQICKEFYDTPMITSCAHTFCSRCIRTSLSADGKCPACRTADQASKLRNNWALQEVVASFIAARPAAIVVARKEQEEVVQARRPGKRKRAVLDSDDIEEAKVEGRTTRSKSRKTAASQTESIDAREVEDSDAEEEDGAYEPEPIPDDGLVDCPLGCGKRMKIDSVEPHLDRCEDEKKQQTRTKSRTPALPSRPPSHQTSRPQERIAELNYSLLKEQPMRKKLEEIGIPGWGTKQLMTKRHTEWVNLWNANCDSSLPRSKKELLLDLETWERTQGGRAPEARGMGSGVMRKDFDGVGWASRHGDEFTRLIADARRMKSVSATKDEEVRDEFGKPALDGREGSSPHFPLTLDSSSSQPNGEAVTTPYAQNPEAIASIREKVEAANAGTPIEPVMNQGFVSQAPPITTSIPAPATSRELSIPAGTDNPALLSQGHFGHDSVNANGSGDEHLPNGRRGTPCELPAHLYEAPRKMPMFRVPSQPVSDVETGGGGGGTH
ncbi:E3 ubiquitin-protein ligase rad18 [Elasticomyces elasticus]|nr:E3 ubiquitin-protein ligase rad18 [Elasticomyces elasticus]KAK3662367.1 E3 ubiquitin-protein ligase rad18 [Elasticomyces elasticus]KAK4924695.1 E3 ubiquitin-protein ligase rad18 [Elasticomyces elasticus]KAK5766900.1 E3 ubiquitin-protein ligase rad18 [Elasticomyces elasticus]